MSPTIACHDPLAASSHLAENALIMSVPPSDASGPRLPGPVAEEPFSGPVADQPVDRSDREAMLRDPVLRRSIAGVLRGRVPDADVEDVLWLTLHAAYDAPSLPPPGGERTAYVLRIAHNKAADHLEALGFKVQVTAGGDEAERLVAAASDPVEARDALAAVAREVGSATTLVWYARVAYLGESISDIAREAGLKYDTVYKRVKAMEERVRAVRVRLVAGTFGVLLVFGAWELLKPSEPRVVLPDLPIPTARPAESTQRPEPIAKERARPLRDQAFRACVAEDWTTCRDLLDQANQIDPDGEDDPRVQAAREDSDVGTSLMPGSKWKPRGKGVYGP